MNIIAFLQKACPPLGVQPGSPPPPPGTPPAEYSTTSRLMDYNPGAALPTSLANTLVSPPSLPDHTCSNAQTTMHQPSWLWLHGAKTNVASHGAKNEECWKRKTMESESVERV